MAKKIEATAGNYLLVTDTITSIEEIRLPTKDLSFRDVNKTIHFYGKPNIHVGQQFGYPFGNATGTVSLDSSAPTAATATVILASAVANTFGSGTVTLASAVANTFGSGTVTLASAVGRDFATGTVTLATSIADDTVTVNGLVYTAVAGVKADNTEFSIDTSNDAAATDLADSIDNDTRYGTLNNVAATSSTDTVTIVSTVSGPGSNAITLASSDGATLAVSAATLTGGADGDTVVVNGLTYTAVAGAKSDDTEFSIDTSDDAAATDLADSIDGDVRVGAFGTVSATASTDTVTITTDLLGTSGNGVIALSSSNGTTLAVSAATLTGGVDADTVIVNGLTYTAVAGARGDNTEFSIDTSDTATATDLAAAITGDVRTGTLGDTTAVGAIAVVTITTDVSGVSGNTVTLSSSSGTRAAVSAATLTGGVDADTVNVNGLTYTAVAGAKSDDTEFSIDTSDDAAATDLADSIDGDVRVGNIGDVTAVAATDTVTITTDTLGIAGNSVKLSSSDDTRLAVSSNFFTGGVADGDITGITVNAVEIMSGTETLTGTLEELAASVAANINANTSTPDYGATSHGVVVTIADLTGDTGANTFVVVSSGNNITTTDVDLAGAGTLIEDSTDTPFTNFAALITFLDANTGA